MRIDVRRAKVEGKMEHMTRLWTLGFWLLLLLLTGGLLLSVGCDRFTRPEMPPPPPTEAEQIALFIPDFQAKATDYLRANEIDTLMTYFADDYLNAGNLKADIEALFTANSGENTSLSITSADSTNIYAFDLSLYDDEVVVSTWRDYLQKRENKFIWVGNQNLPPVADFIADFVEIAIAALQENDIETIMAYFDDDYLNDGKTKDDIEDFFSQCIWSADATIELSPVGSSETLTYRISVSDSTNDVSEVWEDILLYASKTYYWYGNQRQGREDLWIADFTTMATTYLRANLITLLMAYFDDEYLNDGLSKEDMTEYFSSKNWTPNAQITITPYTPTRNNAYSFGVRDTGVAVDTVWVDYLEYIAETYLWKGNQITPPEEETPQYVVLGQAFTSLDCVNCPDSQEKLHEIEELYPDRFIFLEYYIRQNPVLDSLQLYNGYADERTYYGIPNTAPIVIFQGRGNAAISGGDTAQLVVYQPRVEALLAEPAELSLRALTIEQIENRTVSFSVKIDFEPTLDTSNLWLHCAIYEAETTALNRYSQKPATHVVRGRAKTLLENPVSGDIIDFELTAGKPLDDDTYLVVWVQKMVSPTRYTADTDKILNAMKIKLFP